MSIAETQAIQTAISLVDPPLMAVSPVVKLFVVVYHFALGRPLIKLNPCHKDDLPGCEWPSTSATVGDRLRSHLRLLAESRDRLQIRSETPISGFFKFSRSNATTSVTRRPWTTYASKDPNQVSTRRTMRGDDRRVQARALGLQVSRSSTLVAAGRPVLRHQGLRHRRRLLGPPPPSLLVLLHGFHDGSATIRVATSPDSRAWTEPVLLQVLTRPSEHSTRTRSRTIARHLFLGFPMPGMSKRLGSLDEGPADPKRMSPAHEVPPASARR